MRIDQFAEEYYDLSERRQESGLQRLFDYLISSHPSHDDLISDILYICADYENNDGFGTEGFNI